MLFVGSRLTAVIDWEIWSVGDPRFDIAWLLMHARPAHVFHESRPAADRAAGAALPAPGEVLTTYLEARRTDGATEAELAALTADLAWFLAVGYYKTASTTAVIIKRNRKSASPDPKLVVMARHLPEVLAAGHRALEQELLPARTPERE
jgi:aminoglycoside phosphotransferase (APT) family kinase protein